jgi:hypothetical protein
MMLPFAFSSIAIRRSLLVMVSASLLLAASQLPVRSDKVGDTASNICERLSPLPSLEVATEEQGGEGSCDRNYGCSYGKTICFSMPSTPLPMEHNPRKVFQRLFGDGDTPEERALLERSAVVGREFSRSYLEKRLGRYPPLGAATPPLTAPAPESPPALEPLSALEAPPQTEAVREEVAAPAPADTQPRFAKLDDIRARIERLRRRSSGGHRAVYCRHRPCAIRSCRESSG